MAKRTTQHVVAHPDGGRSVKKGGSPKATKRFERQQDAINYAREISKRQRAELYIHRSDGLIRRKLSYVEDTLKV